MKSSSTIKKIVNNSIHNSIHKTATKDISINSNIKKNIIKDLESDTLTYNPEDRNENYQDIFSNSDVNDKKRNSYKSINKSKDKFISNYLKK